MNASSKIEAPKLCKDCRWCVPEVKPGGWFSKPTINYSFARCSHETAMPLGTGSLVDGVARYSCESYRADYEHRPVNCGNAARHWEPRS